MIPKVIHYCWFGKNPLPPLAIKCINSWKKYLPEYEIKEWNEDNFNINIIPYTKEAYEAKKYAFVSDYARFWILYYYGGLYFDTDVEIIKSLDDIIECGAFMGMERNPNQCKLSETVAPGLGLGCPPGLKQYDKILTYYNQLHFDNSNGKKTPKTVVQHISELLINDGLIQKEGIQKVGDIYIYPAEYFCPINLTTREMQITNNTRTIHHYMASWQTPGIFDKFKNVIRRHIPKNWLLFYNKLKNRK